MKERYQALYRVLRPQTFSDMVGQNIIRKTLRNQVVSGRIGHAYLFCGSRGTGKTSAAKIFSRAINCLNPHEGDPCCECASCKSIQADTSLDVIEIDAASNSRVDDIRQLIDQVIFPPQTEKYKVYIIDEVHMLSASAFNALLKTLEEPPDYAVFILATTDPQKVPVTILSRCQRFDFTRLSMDDLLSRLRLAVETEDAKADENALYLIAQAADGGMRDALSILDTCLGISGNITIKDVRDVLGAADSDLTGRITGAVAGFDGASALRCVDEGIRKGMDAQVFLSELSKHFRMLMTAYLCGPDAELLRVPPEEALVMHASAQKFTLPHLQRCLTVFMRAQSDMKFSASPRGVLELALLKACDHVQGHDLSALEEKISEMQKELDTIKETGIRVETVRPDNASEEVPADPADSLVLPQASARTGNEIWNAMIASIRTNRSLFSLISQGLRFGGCQDGEYILVLPADNSASRKILEDHLEEIKAGLVKAGAENPRIRMIREKTEDEDALKRQIMSNEDYLIGVFGREKVSFTD